MRFFIVFVPSFSPLFQIFIFFLVNFFVILHLFFRCRFSFLKQNFCRTLKKNKNRRSPFCLIVLPSLNFWYPLNNQHFRKGKFSPTVPFKDPLSVCGFRTKHYWLSRIRIGLPLVHRFFLPFWSELSRFLPSFQKKPGIYGFYFKYSGYDSPSYVRFVLITECLCMLAFYGILPGKALEVCKLF